MEEELVDVRHPTHSPEHHIHAHFALNQDFSKFPSPYLSPPQKVRRLGFGGLSKKDQKFSKLRDEEWMSMFSYLIQIYEPTLKMDNKANLAGAQKQFVKCVLALHRLSASHDPAHPTHNNQGADYAYIIPHHLSHRNLRVLDLAHRVAATDPIKQKGKLVACIGCVWKKTGSVQSSDSLTIFPTPFLQFTHAAV